MLYSANDDDDHRHRNGKSEDRDDRTIANEAKIRGGFLNTYRLQSRIP